MFPPFPLVSPLPARLESCAEAQILRRARDGDREATALLFGRFRDRMVALAFGVLRDRESAEDAAQEILLRAFEKMPSFQSESEFSAWLYRLGLNLCLDRKRALERRAHLLEGVTETRQHEPSFDGQVETRVTLERALDLLDETSRVVLLLREWHELSYDEIAAILQLPLGTVKSRLNGARRDFRRIWEAQNAD